MTQAQVLLTFASSAASFKIANATPPVGTIVQDGLTAIVGEVGREAPTIPVTVRVTSGAGRRDFHYNILKNRAWSPVLLSLTTANSLVRTTDFDASATLALRYRIDVRGFPPVTLEDLYSGTNPAQPVHLALANDAGSLFNLLYTNRFEEPTIAAVDVDVEVLQGSQVAVVSSRSEEHTSELQSLAYLVCRLLLEKKKKKRTDELIKQNQKNNIAKLARNPSVHRNKFEKNYRESQVY